MPTDLKPCVKPLEWKADHGEAMLGSYRLFRADTPLGWLAYGTDSEGACYWQGLKSGTFIVADEAAAKRQAEASWEKAALAEAGKYLKADFFAENAQNPLRDEVERLREELKGKEADVVRLRRMSTDQAYMLNAYRNMLGDNGMKVVKMWEDRRVTRVHFDWGPDAAKMTGEERAAFILDMEKAPRRQMNFGDGKGPRAKASRAALKETGR